MNITRSEKEDLDKHVIELEKFFEKAYPGKLIGKQNSHQEKVNGVLLGVTHKLIFEDLHSI